MNSFNRPIRRSKINNEKYNNITKWMWIIFVFIGIINIPNNVIGHITNPIVILGGWVVLLLFVIISLWIWSFL